MGPRTMIPTVLTFTLACACLIWTVRTTHAQQKAAGDFQITDKPLRRSWGTVRGVYYDPQRGAVLVLEDGAGTVRFVQANPGHETRIFSELERDAAPLSGKR